MGRAPSPPTWSRSNCHSPSNCSSVCRLRGHDGLLLQRWAVLYADTAAIDDKAGTSLTLDDEERETIEFIHSHSLHLVYGPSGDRYTSLPYRLIMIDSDGKVGWHTMSHVKEAISAAEWLPIPRPILSDPSLFPLLVLARHIPSPRPYCVYSIAPDVTAGTLLVQQDAWSTGSSEVSVPLTQLYQQKYHLEADSSQKVLVASARPAPLKPGKCKAPASNAAVYLLPQYTQLHPMTEGDRLVMDELQHAVPWGLIRLARDVAVAHICEVCGTPGDHRMMAEALTAYESVNGRLAWLGDAFWRVLVTDRFYWSNDYQAEAFVELCGNLLSLTDATLFEPLTLVPPKSTQAVRNKRYADIFEAMVGAVGIYHYKRTRSIQETLGKLQELECFLTAEVRQGNTVKGPDTREWLNLEHSLTVWERSPAETSLGEMNDRRNALLTTTSNSPP